jgi:hypothetical protein
VDFRHNTRVTRNGSGRSGWQLLPDVCEAEIRCSIKRTHSLFEHGQFIQMDYDQRFHLTHAFGMVGSSSPSAPCAAIAPVAVGLPLRIHSKATPISAPKSGPTT